MKTPALKYVMSSKNKNRLEVLIDVYKLRGIIWVIQYFLLVIFSYLSGPLWSKYFMAKYKTNKLSHDFFLFNNKKYKYFFHNYNRTWQNERAIEIPIVKKYLEKFNGEKILELGNVMSHYFKVKYDILDNYEISEGVINKDVIHFKPNKKYNLIFSISTLEHIGIDGVKDPAKAIRAISILTTFLAPNGMLIFTIPLGYNQILDRAIKNEDIKLDQIHFFKKISADNKWIQTNKKDAYGSHYGFPFRWGNAILLGSIKKK